MRILLNDPELAQSLQKQCTSVYCHRDRILFREGDAPTGLYILNRGEAALSTNFSGAELVVSILKTPKALIGLPGLISAKPHALDAIAYSGAQLSFVAREDFTALIQSNSFLFLKVLRLLAAEVEFARRTIFDQLRVSAENAASILSAKRMRSVVPKTIAGDKNSSAVRRAARPPQSISN